MFLSVDELKLAYGVDMRVGKAYVDRKVPLGNAYWEGRKLYMPPVTGFLFMPIFSDLCRRCGVGLDSLLSESYFSIAEAILDSAARLESGDLTWQAHVEECLGLFQGVPPNRELFSDLSYYLRGEAGQASIPLGTPYPSLNRADTYLVSLCAISFDEGVRRSVTQAWYALMTYFLVLDDLADIHDDLRNQEENALLDAGLTEKGIRGIELLIASGQERMLQVNPVMANRMEHKMSRLDVASIVRSVLQSGGA